MRRLTKFRVVHHRRGPLEAGEAFVLVPERDPAAVEAIRAYARSTPDAALAALLIEWVGPDPATQPDAASARQRIQVWTATLADEVAAGRMDVATALQRIAGHAWAAGARTG